MVTVVGGVGVPCKGQERLLFQPKLNYSLRSRGKIKRTTPGAEKTRLWLVSRTVINDALHLYNISCIVIIVIIIIIIIVLLYVYTVCASPSLTPGEPLLHHRNEALMKLNTHERERERNIFINLARYGGPG